MRTCRRKRTRTGMKFHQSKSRVGEGRRIFFSEILPITSHILASSGQRLLRISSLDALGFGGLSRGPGGPPEYANSRLSADFDRISSTDRLQNAEIDGSITGKTCFSKRIFYRPRVCTTMSNCVIGPEYSAGFRTTIQHRRMRRNFNPRSHKYRQVQHTDIR